MQYGKNIIRRLNPPVIPAPVILCIAAILGSVSNLMVLAQAHHADSRNQEASTKFLIIAPAAAQIQVSLPLPATHSRPH